MRFLLLLFLLSAVWSAEYERITIADGSIKTGYFDEQKGTLTLADGSTVRIRISDVVRREIVTPTDKPLKIPPPVTLPDPDHPIEKKSTAPHTSRTDELDDLQSALMEASLARRSWIDALRECRSRGASAQDDQRVIQADAELTRALQAVEEIQAALSTDMKIRQ